jgi:hypothetical protein
MRVCACEGDKMSAQHLLFVGERVAERVDVSEVVEDGAAVADALGVGDGDGEAEGQAK